MKHRQKGPQPSEEWPAGKKQSTSSSYPTSPHGASLDDRHRDELHQSGISDEMIAKARIYSADAAEIARVLNWRPRDWSWGRGLVIPYFFNNEAQPTYHRVKLDNPRIQDGKPQKYVAPPKPAELKPYFPPGFWEAIASPDTPILITEGEKKSLAGMDHGFATIGLAGIWCYASARKRGAGGRGVGTKGLLPNLNAIQWNKRVVFIVFDSDREQKPEIRRAERELAGILRGRGAIVYIVKLSRLGEGKTGLDDFFVHHGEAGPAKLRELMRAAEATKDEPEPESHTPMEWANRYIAETFSHADGVTARHWRDELHHWTGDHYIVVPGTDFTKTLHLWLDERRPGTRVRDVNEIAQCIAARLLIPATIDQPVWLGQSGPVDPGDWVAMHNGILDMGKLTSGQSNVIRPHSPLWFSANSLPHPFDPHAECPNWFEFLHNVLDDDRERIDLLGEWFGLCLTSDTRFQAILMLAGPRRSGKGTTLRMLRRLVGEGNCAAVRLSSLGDPFGLWPLVGKTVAICPDAHLGRGAESIAVMETLKSISGEDEQPIHRKYLPTVNARLKVRFTIAVNDLPKFGDNAGALGSRVLVLPYFNSYTGHEDRDLEVKLSAEASGVFNWAVEGLQRLRTNGRFTKPVTSQQMEEDFERLSSPAVAYLQDRCVMARDAEVRRDDLYQDWEAWCRLNGHLPGSRETFGSQLRTLLPRLDSVSRRDNGGRTRFYVGVRLRTADDDAREGADHVE